MVRRRRDAVIVLLKYAVIGLGASVQQEAFGAGEVPPKLTAEVIKEQVDDGVGSQPLGARLLEKPQAQLTSLALLQPDLVASASQAVGGYILLAQETKSADAPAEPQEAVQETKDTNAPAEPQAVMREIKSATRLSASKQRRRKPQMAGVPIGSPAVVQGEEPKPQAVAQGEEAKPQAVAGAAEEPKPEAMDNLARRLTELKTEREAVTKEKDETSLKRLPLIDEEIAKLSLEYAALEEAWKAKQGAAEDAAQIKQEIDQVRAEIARLESEGKRDKVAELQYGKLPQLEAKLEDATLAETARGEKGVLDQQPMAWTQGVKAGIQGEPKQPDVAGAPRKRYGMAPIRWRVNLSETFGVRRGSQTIHPVQGVSTTFRKDGLVNTQTADLIADTYLLAPYIASMKGNVGVVSRKDSQDNASGVVTTNRANSLFGNGTLSAFSKSRFPFLLSLGSNDSRNNTEYQTYDQVTRYLFADQSYRPRGSDSKFKAGYSRETSDITNNAVLGSPTISTVNHSQWRGSYATPTTEHRVETSAQLNDKTSTSATDMSGAITHKILRGNTFSALDSYLPADSLLSLQSYLNFNTFTQDNSNYTRYLLANSNATWQPEAENVPLFVNGNVHLFNQEQIIQGSATKTRSLGGDASANYLYSKNVTERIYGSVAREQVGKKWYVATKEAAAVDYRPDATFFSSWKGTYSWDSSAGVFNNNGGTVPDRGVTGHVGHGLRLPSSPFDAFSKRWVAVYSINQSVAPKNTRVDGYSTTFINGAGVSLGSELASVRRRDELPSGQGSLNGTVNTTLSLSVSDRRITGKHPSHYRQTSLLLRLQEASSAAYTRPGLRVEATIEGTQGSEGFVVAGTGIATYREPAAFNVRGLGYLGTLSVSTRAGGVYNQSANLYDANAQNPRFPWTIDQRLTYRIGLNELLLRGLVSDANGVKNASLWLLFRAWRSIGS